MIETHHIRRNRWLGGLAAGVLVALGGGPLAIAQTAPLKPTQPATPSDGLTRLGQNVVAVLDLDGAPRLLLVEDEGVSVGARMLGVGDEYRDGWRVQTVTATDVILRKGSVARTVKIEGKTAPPPTPARQMPPMVRISLTNSLVGGTPPPPAPPDDADADPAQSDF